MSISRREFIGTTAALGAAAGTLSADTPTSRHALSARPERRVTALNTAEDLAGIEAKGGVLEQVQKLRDQKLTRFISVAAMPTRWC